jgi:hypothetical protein
MSRSPASYQGDMLVGMTLEGRNADSYEVADGLCPAQTDMGEKAVVNSEANQD